MPSVNIAERDLTGSGSNAAYDFVVLIPGQCDLEEIPAPVLVSYRGDSKSLSLAEYKAKMSPESGIDYTDTQAYWMTVELVTLGLIVLYVPVRELSDVVSSGFYDDFVDKSLYNVRFITTGGYTSKEAIEAATMCAAKRGDAIAITDMPSIYKTASEMQDFIASLTLPKVVRTFTDGSIIQESSSGYGACFAPEVLLDDDNTARPGSFAYLAAFAKQLNQFPEWFATAGVIRGVLPYQNVRPTIALGDIDINTYLTTRNGLKSACNPICEVRPYGNILFGNRTLFRSSEDEAATYGSGLRASHFLNIRQLCCTLKKVLYNSARKFMFEPNSDTLWVNFCESIRPTLEKMKASQGIRGYSIIREATDIKANVKAKIIISPIEAVEDFDFTVELSDSIAIVEG